MPIRIGGMATGMDTDTLVKQLMQAKRVPIDKMKQQRTQMEWKRDSYREMNVLLSQLRDNADKLRFSSTANAKKATSDNTDAVTATAGANAAPGTYQLKVLQMAEVGQQTTDNAVASATVVQSGSDSTLTINGTAVTIRDGFKMSDVASAINSQTSTTGVKAFYDAGTQKMTLSTTVTGQTAQLNVSDSDGGALMGRLGFNTGTVNVTGKNAQVQFGSDPTVIENSSNLITIDNINFTVKKPATPAYTVNVKVEADVDKVFESVKSFVDTYNNVIDKINKKTGEQRYRDFLPLTEEQRADMKDTEVARWEEKAKSGLIRNDATLNSALNKFRDLLGNQMTTAGPGAYNSLYDIGITTKVASAGASKVNYTENGKLYIDETKLKAAIAGNPDQVSKLFTSSGDASTSATATSDDLGIAERIYRAANQTVTRVYKLAGSATENADISTFGLRLRDFDRKIDLANSKLADYEQRYYSQFAKLESSISNMQAQQSWLAQSFSGGQ